MLQGPARRSSGVLGVFLRHWCHPRWTLDRQAPRQYSVQSIRCRHASPALFAMAAGAKTNSRDPTDKTRPPRVGRDGDKDRQTGRPKTHHVLLRRRLHPHRRAGLYLTNSPSSEFRVHIADTCCRNCPARLSSRSPGLAFSRAIREKMYASACFNRNQSPRRLIDFDC